MPLLNGSLSARFWRVTESLPPQFRDQADRNLRRHAFKPIDVEKGALSSMGWVNVRQMLDANLTAEKVFHGEWAAMGLRVDRLTINQKLFRAELAQEVAKTIREKDGVQLSREERMVIEDKVRLDLVKRTQPSVNVYDMAWRLTDGLIVFGSTGEKLNLAFADLFTETFQVSIEPQLPFLRAQSWAERQNLSTELLELLPAPFSPQAPRDVIDMTPAGGDEDEE